MKRIDQWLSNLGYCSRREAREWVEAGLVTREAAGGAYEDAGERLPASAIYVEGERLDHPEGLLLMLNKPLGVVCSHDTREGKRVYDLLPDRWLRRNPALTTIGRLDKDTSGLLLLTDQSALVHRLTSPKQKVPKHYTARLGQSVSPPKQDEVRRFFASGDIVLDGERCLSAEVTFPDDHTAELILMEGRFHQVRRMFTAVQIAVIDLHRSRFGSVVLPDSLTVGQFTHLPLDQSF